MDFKYLTQLNDDIIRQYMNLTNKVIKKVHSIGFLEDLNADTAKDFLNSKITEPKSALLLVFENEKLIGTGYLGPSGYATTQHYGKISKVMVNPYIQGKGVGKIIVDELERKAKKIGYTNILLGTWDVDYIVKFYEKCGYKQVGRIPEFVKYKGKYHDSYFFAKKL